MKILSVRLRVGVWEPQAPLTEPNMAARGGLGRN